MTPDPHTDLCSNNQPQFDSSFACTQQTQPDFSNEAENSSAGQPESPVECSEAQIEDCIPESMLSPSTQEEAEDNVVSQESLHVSAGVDALSQCSFHEAEPSVCAPASPAMMPSTPTKDLNASSALNNELILSACSRYGALEFEVMNYAGFFCAV